MKKGWKLRRLALIQKLKPVAADIYKCHSCHPFLSSEYWAFFIFGLKPMYSFGENERCMSCTSPVNRFDWNHQYFEKIA